LASIAAAPKIRVFATRRIAYSGRVEKRRIGIIGLGAAARNIHLPAIKKVRHLELVGGADTGDAGGFGFPVFGTLEELIAKARPEIVVIVTPPDSHYELIMQALDAGLHVFCEKPFVLTLDEGREVIRKAAECDRQVVINNEFRFMNVHRTAKDLIGTPAFGALQFIAMTQTFRMSEQTEAGWRGQSLMRTCFEFGTHALDLCRFFYDENPRAISARMPRPGGVGGPDYLNLIQLEFSDDRVAHITLDRLVRGRHRYLDTRLDGTDATIEASLGGRAEMAFGLRAASRRPYLNLDFAPSACADLYVGDKRKRIATDPFDLFAQSTARVLEEMLDAIETGSSPSCSAAENLNTLALMLAAYKSGEAGGAFIEIDV